ncbi:MAG: methionyl-tRNA formyltransferase [Patescibacteria group bacterium]
MKNNVRFAFFGTPTLAATFLDDLERNGYVPSLVVTTPDRAQGRGMTLQSPPVKKWADERNIPVLQPERLDENFVAALAKDSYDLFVVIYYGKILPQAVFDMPKRGTINVHFSLLPRWKGTSPIRASILNDDKKAGTTLLLMDEKIDHGPVIAQKEFSMQEWPPSARELEEQATHESAQLLSEFIEPWVAGEVEAHEQNHDLETLCPKLEKTDGYIDLSDDAYQNLLKVRAFDSTIGTHTFFERGGKKIRVVILDAHIEGTRLIPDTVKPEGKKEIPYAEFLRSGAKPL